MSDRAFRFMLASMLCVFAGTVVNFAGIAIDMASGYTTGLPNITFPAGLSIIILGGALMIVPIRDLMKRG